MEKDTMDKAYEELLSFRVVDSKKSLKEVQRTLTQYGDLKELVTDGITQYMGSTSASFITVSNSISSGNRVERMLMQAIEELDADERFVFQIEKILRKSLTTRELSVLNEYYVQGYGLDEIKGGNVGHLKSNAEKKLISKIPNCFMSRPLTADEMINQCGVFYEGKDVFTIKDVESYILGKMTERKGEK